jgi:tripartite-type tricarboxylate transporter receptor subunit TctC
LYVTLNRHHYSSPLIVTCACAAILALAGAPHASAAEPGTYPARSVRVIVPFAPGGSDIVARMLAQKLTEKLGQSFVVENRAGAASVVGTDVVAKAPADGYTVLFCTASHAANAVFLRKLPYDPVRDFEAVASIGAVPFVLVTHPALPVKSVKEFVAFAKSRPGQLFYSSAGTGGIGHLANELFAKEAGIKVSHVPYKGTGPMLTALLIGEVQFSMPQMSGALAMIQAGKVRTLGIAASQRVPMAPEIPTLRESGVDHVSGTWYGVLAPRGAPRSAIDVLNREINTQLKDAAFRDQLTARGLVEDIMAPQEFAAYVKAEIDKWRGVMKAAGIKQED